MSLFSKQFLRGQFGPQQTHQPPPLHEYQVFDTNAGKKEKLVKKGDHLLIDDIDQERRHNIQSITNLRDPWKWYPFARSMKRQIIFHAGPTNSGKTFMALEKFLKAKSGLYCGPLRLLAAEIAQKANKRGVPCDMITGEDKRWAFNENEPALHSARTVEMCPITTQVDCAVVDEIQLLRDRDRGHAWTRAFLGVPAKELHICGEQAALSIVEKLIHLTGDVLEVREYARKNPLSTEGESLGSLSRVEEGDCVVCFSEKDIFKIRQAIEMSSRFKTAVVYGSLPPAVRMQQAAKFNDPKDSCKVMVASDAIGMGLNLNIQRIIFSTLEKFDGIKHTHLTPYHTKQIAGRAGRFGSRYLSGRVTTLHDNDLGRLRKLMSSSNVDIQAAGIWPTFTQVAVLANQLPNATLSELISIFAANGLTDNHHFFCNPEPFKVVADFIEPVSLSLRERYTFCQAPVDTSGKSFVLPALLQFAQFYSAKKRCFLTDVKKFVDWPRSTPKTLESLQDLEAAHEVLNLYLWLSNRFKHVFCDHAAVRELRSKTETLIDKSLKRLSMPKSSSTKRRAHVTNRASQSQHFDKKFTRKKIQKRRTRLKRSRRNTKYRRW